MINVLEYLDNAAARWPDKTAYTDGTRSLTFAQTRQQARSVGTFLAERGHRNTPIVVLMERGPDTVAAFLGAAAAGCAYVPMDSEMGRSRMEGILSDLQPSAILVSAKTRPLLDTLPHNGDVYDYHEIRQTPARDELLDEIRLKAIDTDLLYIVYTSGSTGRPKGVAACHRSVIDYIESLSAVLGVTQDTVFGNQTPLYVDACLKELYPTLKCGAEMHILPKNLFLFPAKLIEALNARRVNTICWVVSALTILSGTGMLDKAKPEHLHTIAFGSELFPAAQLDKWRKALPNARFLNLYGPTECTGMSCYYELPARFPADTPVPIGKPFPNTQILLLNGDTLVTQPSQEGEICIRGTALTLGYYGDWDKTDASFVQNPLNKAYRELIYRTGDMGQYNDRGDLLFVSRRDHQIKHMGHRIELGEIESAMSQHPDVVRAVCIHQKANGKILLYYTGSLTSAEAARFLKERLPRFMCPNGFFPLEEMPLTPNGKIDRAALQAIPPARPI